MARFSLSPSSSCSTRGNQRQRPSQTIPSQSPPTTAKTPPQWKWNFPPQDQYYRSPFSPTRSDDEGDGDDGNDWDDESSDDDISSSDESDTHSNEDDSPLYADDSDPDSEEEEPPHPLGFESRYGRTRFGLSPRSAALDNRNSPSPPLRDIYDREDEYAWNALIHIDDDERRNARDAQLFQQSFPPIQSYHLSHQSVSTKQLLRGASSQREEESMEELLSGMDRIANLVRAASHVGATNNVAVRQPPQSQPHSTAKLLQLAQACEYQQSSLSREMSALQQQRDRSHQQSCQGFLLLLKADAARVSSANERIAQRQRELEEMEEQERLDRKAHEERLRRKREEEERAEAERIAADAARTEGERKREEARREQLKKAEEEAELEDAKKNAHVDRAKSLIDSLERVRGGLREFDKSKSVGRRRLQFKKIVNGRINTLSHDEGKILEVGRTVCDAISNAANDDAASSGGEPVAGMGKKYLLDLLCANLVVRVQADGFNGTRGDGFALAGTFAFVSTKCEEIGPVLEGHLYTVCPMAIPAMSLKHSTTTGGSNGGGNGGGGDEENDLMESLGMIKEKSGEFESFDKFLHRTEGLISIMADIMSSLPSDHALLGGHRGALTWLQRFMDLLPPPPASPLPLLTAPVLVAFLTGAGHMLANRYPNEFRTMFDAMKKDVVNRLDDSPIGVPSATRLRKVLEEWGFEGLRKDLPQGAVKALYDDGKDASTGMGGAVPESGMVPPASSAFGTGAPASSPFGQVPTASSALAPSLFGATPSPAAPAPSPFGTAPAPAAPAPSQFGTAPAASPFGAAPGPSAFGTDPAPEAPASAPFGTAPASSPFGAAPASSPFGRAPAPAAPAPSPFGGATVSEASAPSPFGGAAPAPSPFGTAPGPSPFGASPGPSPFGTAPGPSPFGTAPGSSPFGTAPSAPAPSPFGGAAPAPSAFGMAPAPSAFGGAAPAPSPFGTAPAQSAFGTAPAPSHFGSAPGPTPFGTAPGPSTFGGGGQGGDAGKKKQPCKFFASGKCNFGDKCKFSHEMGGSGGGGGSCNPSPFGNPDGQPSNAFGGGGGGSKKQPCKFFASGNCRNGDSCRFSHETSGSGGNASFGAFGSSGSTNNQSFGGGGGGFGSQQSSGAGGGFGGSSTFGSTATSSTAGFGASSFGGPRR